jgi:hypothetical protein
MSLPSDTKIRRVIVESPYASDTAAGVEANLAYARRCVASLRSLMPLPPASHDCSSAARTCCSHASTLGLDRARSTAGANDHKRP